MSIGSFGRSVADMFVHILICCHPADRLEYASKTILALDGRNENGNSDESIERAKERESNRKRIIEKKMK